MARAGLDSLFPMEDVTAIGIWAVVVKMPTILRRLRDTLDGRAIVVDARHQRTDEHAHLNAAARQLFDRRDAQVRALAAGARLIGVNNRDLQTLATDVATSVALLPMIPAGCVAVSESGIFTRDDVQRLGRMGVHAVLVGEALVTARDVAAKVRDLV